ncbi:nickel-dependent hydrogenase large subunit [Elusimicrobiota bacterium]
MGKVTIPIGPQHPALKEPESFRITLEGEKIVDMKILVGYNHRGVEKACEQRTFTQDVYLIERVCGICSHTHSTCFVQGVEELANVEVPKRGLYIRTIVAELERIHSHLLWLGVAGHEIGFDTLLMYSWRDREVVMDILALITGNRVHYAANVIGGVKRDITPENLKKIMKSLDILEKRTKYYVKVATEEVSLIERLSKVGYLSHDDAVRLGAVGPTGRASGIDADTRRDDPYASYADVDFKVITSDLNDVYGRTVVRVLELIESYKIIRQLIDKLPEGPVSVRVPRKIPQGEVVSRYEAPRGEDIHYIKSNGTEIPERVKVRAPTLANIQAVTKMLEDGYLADSTIAIAAIDPCFSCTDRMIIGLQDPDGKPRGSMDWKALRNYSIEWNKKNRGIDFSKNKLFKG